MTSLTPRLREFGFFDSPFRSLHREFEPFFRSVADDQAGFPVVPAVEFTETPEAFHIKAELPGLDAKDIELQVSGDVLTVSGEKSEEKRSENANVHFTERRYGKWQRSFRLPNTADSGRVEATITNGVLDIAIGKRIEAKSQVIKVKNS